MGGDSGFVDGLIDHGVAALFALACAYPAVMLLGDFGVAAMGLAGLCAAIAFAVARRALIRIDRDRRRQPFNFVPIDLPQTVELPVLELGRDAHDELASIAAAMETVPARVARPCAGAGELAERIDRHLARRRA